MNQSQNNRILYYLMAGKKLTPMKALSKFKTMRLGARIYDLRKRGYNIQKETFKTLTGKTVARYFL